MGKINKALLMVIAMVLIMIAAVGIDKGVQHYHAAKWERERVERYEIARADVNQIQMTISQVSQSQEALEAFIEENKEFFDKTTVSEEKKENAAGENEGEIRRQEEETVDMPESISENSLYDVSGNVLGDISGNGLYDVSGNVLGDISGNSLYDVSGNVLGDISENSLYDVSENSLHDVSGNALSTQQGKEQESMGSYAETVLYSREDRKIIEESELDFSQVKIACIGDSITAATNLDGMENYEQYAYPARLKTILGAERVTNLGIGGSSIGRYWENAFVERYREIPEDTDIIIVMGGTNDGFCLTEEEFGTMEERSYRTFIGDLDELLRGLEEDYPDAQIVLATPLSNVLHDMLRKNNESLLPQYRLADAMKELAEEYELPVIDLYYSNLLNTHDAAIIYNYMPDGVHCNEKGYEILAQHFAAELIKLYGTEEAEGQE